MKITRLIEIFEQLLPIYEKGYNKKYCAVKMSNNYLDFGICCASLYNGITDRFELRYLFDNNGYYGLITNSKGFLFPLPDNYKDLKHRIDFMKSEIKSLKKLLKQGYTHV